MLTDCSIQTRDADETLDFDFTSANVVNKIIMKAECLREAFAEMDMSSDVIEILLSPSVPYFRLTTFGYAGTTQVWNNGSLKLRKMDPYFIIVMYCIVNVQGKKLCMNDH